MTGKTGNGTLTDQNKNTCQETFGVVDSTITNTQPPVISENPLFFKSPLFLVFDFPFSIALYLG